MSRKADSLKTPQKIAGNQRSASVFVVTCEHGGNTIPSEYRRLFAGAGDVLKSHRGWDPGALRVAETMSGILGFNLFSSTQSRLLVELNRSLGHRSLFSTFTGALPQCEKRQIISQHWQPYREEVTQNIDQCVNAGCDVVHLSIHSFTPVMDGRKRRTDIGLLYDPRRTNERSFCGAWKAALRLRQPAYTIHSNQPYRGIADGFTTALRRRYANGPHLKGSYVGVEVEINQAMIYPAAARQIRAIADFLCEWPLTLTSAIST